ncbi:histidyl tRNA synthetase [Wigglesworthia glossinidia endosymbiont of Glossina morsitans morsitans (Yale colony)]|uniref:Histidine--tRNA ligase n=1 Tax=Wigglesworthia glossinidia endosymbiont of Glossina morsitans morsitans (Yale colony) TaxID=1142511 RepID=H6Q4G2_WIGGL|nr:histidine--tRNA ligase [Wigglesworthia glossinidia]AFA41022.1 histidyl tRNA synthetase [Wigglesworthia glossinidia endosymbiont of Glossina morsitans morsitans (Yale colony)]
MHIKKNTAHIVRGMKDILPEQTNLWRFIEKKIIKIISNYNYQEIRFPILEHSQVFSRAIGNNNIVVKKEMYTFLDRNSCRLALRPEGTAGCVRSAIYNNLFHNNSIHKLWYIGPMFRYERPQKGRYRQFSQIGLEIFGSDHISAEFELILLTSRIWKNLNIDQDLILEINSIGNFQERENYLKDLKKFIFIYSEKNKIKVQFDFNSNPSKIINAINLTEEESLKIPKIFNYIGENSKNQFLNLCKLLKKSNIPYKINSNLFRGLDYYNDIIFEWMPKILNYSNIAICSGGRYDNLVRQLGGMHTPALGCAIGLDRLILLVEFKQKKIKKDLEYIDIYVITITHDIIIEMLLFVEHLRSSLSYTLKIMTDISQKNCKKKLKTANKLNAKIALILGKKEIKANNITIKYLNSGIQETVHQSRIINIIKKYLKN